MFEKWNLEGIETAEAHCDAPCGVYDPSQARVEAESVLQLTKKILDLKRPDGGDEKASVAYQNTLSRFIVIKEERADLAKHHLGCPPGARRAQVRRTQPQPGRRVLARPAKGVRRGRRPHAGDLRQLAGQSDWLDHALLLTTQLLRVIGHR